MKSLWAMRPIDRYRTCNKMFTELASQYVHCYACCVVCGTVFLKPHVMPFTVLHFGRKKSSISSHGLPFTVTLHFAASLKKYGPMMPSVPKDYFFWMYLRYFLLIFNPKLTILLIYVSFGPKLRASILVIKLNDLQTSFVYKTIHG